MEVLQLLLSGRLVGPEPFADQNIPDHHHGDVDNSPNDPCTHAWDMHWSSRNRCANLYRVYYDPKICQGQDVY